LSPYYLDSQYMSGPVGAQQGGKRSSHNTFLSALVEQGVPGAVLFIMMWLWCLRALARARAAQPSPSPQLAAMVAGVGSALISFLVAGMFVDYLKAEVQFWLFAVLALYPWLAQRDAVAASAPEGALAAGRATRQNSAARPAGNPTRGIASGVRDKRG
jgi:O-antigen ligase